MEDFYLTCLILATTVCVTPHGGGFPVPHRARSIQTLQRIAAIIYDGSLL